jgi:hypothetical protein
MANDKTAKRFTSIAIPLLVAEGYFKQWENFTERMAVLAIIERAVYDLAIKDAELELEETDEEMRLHEKKIFDFNPLKLAIEQNGYAVNLMGMEALYQRIKPEVKNASCDFERNGSNEMVGAEKTGRTFRAPAARSTVSIPVKHV